MCEMYIHATAGAGPRKEQRIQTEEKAGIVHFNDRSGLDHLKMTVKQYVKCIVRVDLHEMGHEQMNKWH